MENRRFELGPPGESKLPLSNRKYTDFLKILIIRISISFWIFIEDFAYYFTTNRTFLVGYGGVCQDSHFRLPLEFESREKERMDGRMDGSSGCLSCKTVGI